MSFLPPPSMRHIMAVPRQDKVDFRAACFCHKNIVDIGFVCSVCLSSEFCRISFPGLVVECYLLVFCSPVPVCSTCRFVVCRDRRVALQQLTQTSVRTKFPMKTLQRLNASRPSIPPATPPANGVSNGSPRPPSARPNQGMSASLR